MTSVEEVYKNAGILLKRKSDKYWSAKCPFGTHEDKTPSFIVYRNGDYRCFGCNRFGSISDWNKDNQVVIARIDLTQVEDVASKAIDYLLQHAEDSVPVQQRNFMVYDFIDKTAIDLKLDKRDWNRVELALFLKQQIAKFLGKVEGSNGNAAHKNL